MTFPRITIQITCPRCLEDGRVTALVRWFIPTVTEDADRAPIFLDRDGTSPTWREYAVGGDTGPGTERDRALGLEWSKHDTTRPGDTGHVKHEATCPAGCGYHYKRRASTVRRFVEYIRAQCYAPGAVEVYSFDGRRADEVMNNL